MRSPQLVSYDEHRDEMSYMVNQDMYELRPLHSWRFETETACMLAISMWLAMPTDDREINHFRHTFINVLRMIGAKTMFKH